MKSIKLNDLIGLSLEHVKALVINRSDNNFCNMPDSNEIIIYIQPVILLRIDCYVVSWLVYNSTGKIYRITNYITFETRLEAKEFYNNGIVII